MLNDFSMSKVVFFVAKYKDKYFVTTLQAHNFC